MRRFSHFAAFVRSASTAFRRARWPGIAGLFVVTFLVSACGSLGQKLEGWPGLAPGDRITVLPLTDHPSSDPEDTRDTGIICHRILVENMRDELERNDIDAYVPEAYDTTRGFSREEAVALGAERSSKYVLLGRCHVFFRVAPFTFRPDRGGIDVEIVSVADGKVVYRLTHDLQVSNINTPETAIDAIADVMADELAVEE